MKDGLTYQSPEVTEQCQQELPRTVQSSLELLNNGGAASLLGQEFIELFTAIKSNELASFQRAITDWERNSYGPQV